MGWCRTAGRDALCGQTATLLEWPSFLEYSVEETNTSKMMREMFHGANMSVSNNDIGVNKSRTLSGHFGEFPPLFFNSFKLSSV